VAPPGFVASAAVAPFAAFVAPAGAEAVALLGSGSVFVAALVREIDGDRVVVCKRLAPNVREERAARAAMAREGELLARVRHPSIPELVRVGSDAHGPFLVETHVEGASALALVEGWRARGRPVPPRLVAHLASAAFEALAGLHALGDHDGPLGIVHGDLAPAHLILAPLGDARFVDLGAARHRGMDPRLETDDRGTLPYAAPELARGVASPSQATDVYALAATLLFLAIGEPLSEARDEGAMLLEIGERGLRPELCDRAEALDARGRDALRRALALDPADRLVTASVLAAAFA
jgi:eukaryotic-like serine/threonine-protein kinase